MSLVAEHAAKLAAAEQSFRAVFYEALEETQAKWQALISLLAMTLRTPGVSQETHRWLGPVPQMVKWEGDRRIGKLAAEGFTIVNYDWANGFEIDIPSLRRDKLGQYNGKVKQLAQRGYLHQLKLLVDLLNGGFAADSYDGVTFFNNAHPGAVPWNNATDDVLDQGAYQAAVTRLKAVKDVDGEPLELQPTHLLVSSSLEWVGREILENPILASGAGNITKGTAQLVVLNRLTAGYWFVADFSQAEKPLILQIEDDIKAAMQTTDASDDVFHRNKVNYGAQWAGGAGYGLPELIQGSDGTGS